jgi:hypothetical protein
VYRAGSGDHSIAWVALVGEAKIGASVRDELVKLVERAGVQQQRDALAGGELPTLVLLGYPSFASA